MAVGLLSAAQAIAQEQPATLSATLDFREPVSLQALTTYVSARTGARFIYNAGALATEVTIDGTIEVPLDDLVPLLETLMKSQGLVVVSTPVEGVYQVLPADQLPTQSVPGDAMQSGPVTRVFALDHTRIDRVQGVLEPLLSTPGGRLGLLPESQVVVVSDYAENVERVAKVLAAVDQRRMAPSVEVVSVEHADAIELREALAPLVEAAAAERAANPSLVPLAVSVNKPLNQVVIAGPDADTRRAATLVRTLDAERRPERRVYRPQHLTAVQFEAITREVLVPNYARGTYSASTNDSAGVLVVSAPPPLHERISDLLADVDAPVPAEQNPVRFYRLKNTKALDLLATLQALDLSDPRGLALGRESPLPGQIVTPLARSTAAGPGGQERADRVLFGPDGERVEEGLEGSRRRAQPQPVAPLPTDGALELPPTGTSAAPGAATVAADVNTNSIIVIAPPIEQQRYERIIRELDRRRPQVLIETTIVALDTSDDFTLGVEIGTDQDIGDSRLISFSAFGIREFPETDPLNPELVPALGGNFAILSPDVADVVVRALAQNQRSRLVSMPRVLVNDNETGLLASVAEEPFQRTVITDDTVIVGEGDSATAGTEIEVTPSISDGGYVQLEYAVELSAFTGPNQPNLPPPSQVNEVSSRVTIPDGHTIVVGGLNQSNYTEAIDKVPLLGDLPLLGHLFRSTTQQEGSTTLFVFIRPVVLEHEAFADLKHLSRKDREAASVESEAPPGIVILSEPDAE